MREVLGRPEGVADRGVGVQIQGVTAGQGLVPRVLGREEGL